LSECLIGRLRGLAMEVSTIVDGMIVAPIVHALLRFPISRTSTSL